LAVCGHPLRRAGAALARARRGATRGADPRAPAAPRPARARASRLVRRLDRGRARPQCRRARHRARLLDLRARRDRAARAGARRAGVTRAFAVAAALAFAPAAHAACPPPTQPPAVPQVTAPRWVAGVLVTEYFPAPERWFGGPLVHAPGLALAHRSDWLYSARGLAMQGEGIGTNGRLYHFAGPYSLAWLNARGA